MRFRVDGRMIHSLKKDFFKSSAKFGGRYADRDQTARFSVYNWGVLSEQWGNRGPVWLDDNVDNAFRVVRAERRRRAMKNSALTASSVDQWFKTR